MSTSFSLGASTFATGCFGASTGSTFAGAGAGLAAGTFFAFSSSKACSRALLAARSSFSIFMCFSICAFSSSSALVSLTSLMTVSLGSFFLGSFTSFFSWLLTAFSPAASSSFSFFRSSRSSSSICSLRLCTSFLAFSSCSRRIPTCGSSMATGTSTGSLLFAWLAASRRRRIAVSSARSGEICCSSSPHSSSRCFRSCAASSRHFSSSSFARLAASASRAAVDRNVRISASAFFSWSSKSSVSRPVCSLWGGGLAGTPGSCSSLIFSSTTSLTNVLVCSSSTKARGS
mmetsp:Transcript_136788/g.381301  ORF Transcript_136788/g.381301 Transcript_136788/m.381301 type:complete len:288 (+) Transcript_136788:2104-2967(+)